MNQPSKARALLQQSWRFLLARKWLWLPPIIAMLSIVGGLIIIDLVARIVPLVHGYFR